MPNRDPLGNLVGGGPSKVGLSGAMRARDVARPSAEDLADAERELVIRRAATRVDTRPLPTGVRPAEVPADRDAAAAQGHAAPPAKGRARGRSRPRPGPPPLA